MGETLELLRHDQVTPSEQNLRESVGDVAELAQSIEGAGLLQPMVARRTADGKVVLVAGARRHAAIGLLIEAGRAKKAAKWPVLVRDDLDDGGVAAAMLVENLHRQDLTPVEQMRGLVLLQREHGWPVDRIEKATGIARSTVKRRLSWAALPDHVLEAIGNRITVGYADELAALPAELRRTLLTGKKIPTAYDIDEAKRQRDRHAEIRKITKVLVEHGHLVVDEAALERGPGDQAQAVLDALEREVAEINARGGRGELQQIRYPSVAAYLPDRIADLTPGQLFQVDLGPYNINVVLHVAVDTSAPADDQDDDEEEDDEPVERSDWERDYAEASSANARASREYQEQSSAAQRAFVQEAPPATLTAWALSAVIRGDADGDAQWYVSERVKKLCGQDMSDAEFREWSHTGAATLARAAAATILETYYSVEMPAPFHVPDPEPIPYPDRKDYDSTGRRLSAGDEPAPDEPDA